MKSKELTITDLPKVSLNLWYAGTHWSKRKQLKDIYKLILSGHKQFPKTEQYRCRYDFTFKNNPLDASNCIAMVKMVEDILFEDDKHDIVKELSMSSCKGKRDSLTLTVECV